MSFSNRWLTAPLFVAASFLLSANAPTAQAQYGSHYGPGISLSIGRGYTALRPSYGHSYAPNYGSINSSYLQSYYGSHYGQGYYHDTSHYDYHPTQVIRHGNHLHVQPGHYDYHQSGHYHR